jgi:hypothetical protein
MVGIGGGYISRALRETLASVVSPDVCERIIAAALEAESLRELPTSPWRFRQFLDGALGEVLVNALGPEDAEPIVQELAGIAAIAERDHVARTGSVPPMLLESPRSGIQARPPELTTRKTDPYQSGQLARLLADLEQGCEINSEPPSSRNYPLGTAATLGVLGTASVSAGGASQLPLVLVATSQPDLLRTFSAWLDPRAIVQRVANLLSLLSELSSVSERRVVVVIDARSPSVKPLSLAAIADDVPASARVVLWGMNQEGYARMLRMSGAVSNWLLCDSACPTSEVVAQCVRLVG